MCKQEDIHRCTWHQDTLGLRSMIDFVVISCDFGPHILDTQVKRGLALSTDHHLLVSWMHWKTRRPDRLGRPKRMVRVCWEHLVAPLVRDSSTPTSSRRASSRFQARQDTWFLSGPCSLPLMSPSVAVAVRSIMPVVVEIPKIWWWTTTVGNAGQPKEVLSSPVGSSGSKQVLYPEAKPAS